MSIFYLPQGNVGPREMAGLTGQDGQKGEKGFARLNVSKQLLSNYSQHECMIGLYTHLVSHHAVSGVNIKIDIKL